MYILYKDLPFSLFNNNYAQFASSIELKQFK